MASCPKCGAAVNDAAKFCGACGTPIGAAATPPPIGSPTGSNSGVPPVASSGGIAPNVAAMLTYIPLCLIGLVCAILFGFVLEPYKNNRFVRFHAWQSIGLNVVVLGFGLLWTIVSTVLTAIMHFFVIFSFPVSILVAVGGFVVAIFLMIKAYGNESFKLPVLGDWADQRAGS